MNLYSITDNYLFKSSFNSSFSEETSEIGLSLNDINNIKSDSNSFFNNSLNNTFEPQRIRTPPKPIHIKKKRGRKKGSKSKKNFIHDSIFPDNILAKIQTHFLTFLINISNDALITEFGNGNIYCFKNINYSMKKKVKYEYFKELLSYSIKNILQMDISKKYTIFEKEHNKIILNVVCQKSTWLNNFFNMNYLNLFKYYYNKKKPINGINYDGKYIKLSYKTKCFYDLLEKNEEKTELIRIVKNYYFNGNDGDSINIFTISNI